MKKLLSAILSVLIIISSVLALPITSNAIEDYRAWSQTDPRWSGIRMGNSNCTIGSDGCLVSSVTKLIIQAGFKNSSNYNIGTLAKWLNNNDGYDGAKLKWAKSAESINGFSYYNSLVKWGSYNSANYTNQIVSWVKSGYHMALAVNNGGHWVAVDEAKTLSTGKVYIMDSGTHTYAAGADVELTSRYSTFNIANAYEGGQTPNVIPTGSKTVSDGEYHIVSALSGSSCVTVAGASKNDCANVQLWNSATPGNTNQLFTLKYLSNGNYVITSRNSKKCLDVKNGSTASGANVWQYKANNSKAQQWIVKPAGDQYFYIISALSGKYLDVSGGSSKNGTNIQVYNGNNSAAQKWKFLASGAVSGQTIKNGEYTIASALDNNVGLNIFGGKTENGANIHIWNNMKSGNLVNTIVKVKHLGNGIYTLTFKRSNKVLDIYGSHTTSGTNVHQWEYVGKDNQKWIIKSAGNGYYYIIGRGSGLALDIYCGNKANGTNVWAYLKNNSNAQKWKFFAAPTLNKTSITINKGKTYKIFVKGQSATAATYSSTNKSIATVNKNGVITGKKKGTATIKVAYRGVSLSCKVTVK